MTFEKMNLIQKCVNCGSISNFKLSVGKYFYKDICLCKKCVSDLYGTIGKFLIPKSLENINKKIKVKE